MRNILTCLLALGILSGCDIIDMPKNAGAAPPPPDGGTVTRRVLIEDCTGMLCNNCPAAADIGQGLEDYYNVNGTRVILVSISMLTSYSAPQPPIGDGIFDTDFRTPAGTEYESTFQIGGLPTGLISRKPSSNSIRVNASNWSSAVAQIIDLPPEMDLWFDSLNYNSATNVVTATVKAAVLTPITAPRNLTVYLTEDHVIDWQIDNRLPAGQDHIPNYDHRHVLRDNLNGTWGDVLIPASAQPGDT
ncbi:MAG: Omp28-related outer membrane protein, partial [Flavobacteriales bacterium]